MSLDLVFAPQVLASSIVRASSHPVPDEAVHFAYGALPPSAFHARALHEGHMGGGKSDPAQPKSDQTSWGVISEVSQKEQAHGEGHEPGGGNFQQVRLQWLERELLELKGKLARNCDIKSVVHHCSSKPMDCGAMP